MTIPDPTAVPESQQTAEEYLVAADDYWSNNRREEALVLYWSLLGSSYFESVVSERQGEIMLRVGTVAEAQGDLDRAWRAYRWGQGLGNEECIRRLATVNESMPDQAIDPSVPPATMEALSAYTSAAGEAESTDPESAARIYEACLDSPVMTPIIRGHVALQLGNIYQRAGSHDAAYRMFEEAALNASDSERAEAHAALRKYQHQDGVDHDDLSTSGQPTDEADAGRYLQGAIDAYDRGDTARAEALANVVLAADVSSTSQRGGAHYHLGALAYYAQNHDVARIHPTNAENNAAEPYQAWAREMLQFVWQQ